MALFNTWSNTNKQTSATLNVQYDSSVAYTDGSGPIYSVRRVASKNYAYVGMTKDAAESCLAAKRAQYFRAFANYKLEGSTITPQFSYGCTASMGVAWAGGSSYSVKISVNETDTILTREDATSLEALQKIFLFAEVRDYDEDSPAVIGIAISTANFDTASQVLSIYYQSNISNLITDAAHLFVEYQNRQTGEWAAVTNTPSYYGGQVVVTATERPLWRLRYSPGGTEADVISNEVAPTDDPSKALINIKKCILDPLLIDQTIEFDCSDQGISPTVLANRVRVQYFNESAGEWKDVSNSSYQVRAANYVIITPVDGNLNTFRLWYTHAGRTNYSKGFVSTGESMSQYTLAINSAKIFFGEEQKLYCDVTLDTTIPHRFFDAAQNRLGAKFVNGIDTYDYAYPTSFYQDANGKTVARFTHQEKGAYITTSGTETVKCWWGTLTLGQHLAETSTVTPTVATYSLAITNAISDTDSDDNYIGKLNVTTDMPDSILSSITVQVSDDYDEGPETGTFRDVNVVSGSNGVVLVASTGSAIFEPGDFVRVKFGNVTSRAVMISMGSITNLAYTPTRVYTNICTMTDVRLKYGNNAQGLAVKSLDPTCLSLIVAKKDGSGTPQATGEYVETVVDGNDIYFKFKNVQLNTAAVGGADKFNLVYAKNGLRWESPAYCMSETYEVNLDSASQERYSAAPLELKIQANLAAAATNANLSVEYSSSPTGTFTAATIVAVEGKVIWTTRVPVDSYVRVKYAITDGYYFTSNVLQIDKAGCDASITVAATVGLQTRKKAYGAFTYNNIPNFTWANLRIYEHRPSYWRDLNPAFFLSSEPQSYTADTKTAYFEETDGTFLAQTFVNNNPITEAFGRYVLGNDLYVTGSATTLVDSNSF